MCLLIEVRNVEPLKCIAVKLYHRTVLPMDSGIEACLAFVKIPWVIGAARMRAAQRENFLILKLGAGAERNR